MEASFTGVSDSDTELHDESPAAIMCYMSKNRQNILFVLSDQQRWDTVECYGEPLFEGLTPNLDQMAADGVLFTHTFSCQPVCGPARSCLQTGLFATRTGCFTNFRGLPEGQQTIAHELSGAGYDTAYIGKWHLAGRWENYTRDRLDRKPIPVERRGGYDYWLATDAPEFTSHGYEGYLYDRDNHRIDFEGYRPDRLTDFAIDYLRSRVSLPDAPPFMLFLSYIEPHQQNDLGRYIGPIGSKQKYREYRVPGDLAGTDGYWRSEMPDYLGCCGSLDHNVGRLLYQLDLLGLSENTLVVYTSDHGNHFGTRNGEAKRSPHENSIHVPLIIRGPGFTGGAAINNLVSLIDLPPTLLSAAGIEPSWEMDGRALQQLFTGDAAPWPDEVFVQVSEAVLGRAIRTHRWKYGVSAPDRDPREDSTSDRYVETWLYDLEHDPHERQNLASDRAFAGEKRELRRTLIECMRRAGEGEPAIEGAEAK